MLSRNSRPAACLLAGFLFAAAAGAAAPVPLAAPFKVSLCTTCLEQNPRIAGAKSGAFMTVWSGSSTADPKGIASRVYTTLGAPRGGDLAITKQATVPENDGNVAVTTQGKYVVVWSAAAASGHLDIKGQLFLSTGVAAGAVFTINIDEPTAPSIPDDFNPVVAPSRDGGFVVAWVRILPATITFQGTPPQIWARRFNASGAPLSAPVQMNTALAASARPSVCVDTANQAILVWTPIDRYEPFVQSKNGVAARRLSPTGAPVGPQIAIAPPVSIPSTQPQVACLAGGAWVVAWQSDQAPGVDGYDIVAQRWTKLPRAAGPVFLVNTHIDGRQVDPAIAADFAGNNFVITWDGLDSTPNPDLEGIYGRSYTAAGVASGSEFAVYQEPRDVTQPTRPTVAYVGGVGQFVIAWQEGFAVIMGRRFKP